MKKFGVFFMSCFLAACAFLFSGCENSTGGSILSTSKYPKNSVTAVLEKLNTELNIDNENIHEDVFQRINYEDLGTNEYDINGYTCSKSGVSLQDLPNLEKVFDGRYTSGIGDGMDGSLIEYSKDDIICYYSEFLDQDIPDELMMGDWDENLWSDFMKSATYEITLSCGKIPAGVFMKRNLYLNAVGDNRNASIRGGNITRFSEASSDNYYISYLHQDEDGKISFEGYEIAGNVIKDQCTDSNGDSHEYTISFVIGGDLNYMGCADAVKYNFIVGEQGTLSQFINKTNYQYNGYGDKEKISYSVIDMVNDYIYVELYEDSEDSYTSTQIILENTAQGWKVLYEGDYEVDSEKCEELNQYDSSLMDMFFLRNCPRG